MSAVAVLLTATLNAAATTKSPASSARGPASPTTSSSTDAIWSAAPVSCSAVDTGISPAIRITVVQDTAR